MTMFVFSLTLNHHLSAQSTRAVHHMKTKHEMLHLSNSGDLYVSVQSKPGRGRPRKAVFCARASLLPPPPGLEVECRVASLLLGPALARVCWEVVQPSEA